MLAEGAGVPIGLDHDGANRNGHKLLKGTLDSIPIERPEPTPAAPQGICLDKAYDNSEVRELIGEYQLTPHIRARGEGIADKVRTPGWRARHWVIEATHSWLNRNRGLIAFKKAHTAQLAATLPASGLRHGRPARYPQRVTEPDTPTNLRTFLRLLAFLRPYRISLGVSVVLAVVSQGSQIGIAFLTGDIINAIRDGHRTRLWWLVGAVAAASAAKAAALAGRRFIAGNQSLGVEYDMRTTLYGKLVRLSFGFYDRHQTGQLMSRATVDLTSVRMFLGYGLIFIAQHLLTVVGVTAVMFVVDWRLALIGLAVTPLLVAVAYRYSAISHPVLRDVQQRLADVATAAEESIVGVHVVKAFAQEPATIAAFEARSQAVFEQTVRANRQRAFYVPLLGFLPLVAQAAVLLVGARMVVDGSLALGSFFTFNLLLMMLIMPLRMLGNWIGLTQRATASGERIFQIMDEPETVADLPGARDLSAGPGRVRFEGVDFAYREGRPVLAGIDLELEPGRTVALIGQTGAGKTTLAALVPRFYDATRGRVLVDGVDVRDVTLRSLRREIGVVTQDPLLFSASVRENIAFGRAEATDEQVERAARLAQAHEFIERLPGGYDTLVGERGVTLSGGQRQRLAIARALLVDPRILILDDATASVDATTEARIRAGLEEAKRGRTTIIIAHRLSTIALADEIVVLDEGHIAARGTHDELLVASPVYREIHEHGLLERQAVEIALEGAA